MTDTTEFTAGINFPWKYVEGLFMCVRSFIPLTKILGDEVQPSG
jgi:hypothetical protein